MRWLLQRRSPGGVSGALSVMIFHRVRPVADLLCPNEVDAARFDRMCNWLARWFVVLHAGRLRKQICDRDPFL